MFNYVIHIIPEGSNNSSQELVEALGHIANSKELNVLGGLTFTDEEDSFKTLQWLSNYYPNRLFLAEIKEDNNSISLNKLIGSKAKTDIIHPEKPFAVTIKNNVPLRLKNNLIQSTGEISLFSLGKPEEVMLSQEAYGTTCTIGQGAQSHHNIYFKKNIFPAGFWESYHKDEIAQQLVDSLKKGASLDASKLVPTLFTLLGDAQNGFITASMGNCRCFLMGFEGDNSLRYFEQLGLEKAGADGKLKNNFYNHIEKYENNCLFALGFLNLTPLLKKLPQLVKVQLLVLSNDFFHPQQTPKSAIEALNSCFDKLEKIPGLLSCQELTENIYLYFEHQLGKMEQKAVIIQPMIGEEKNSAPFMFTLCEGVTDVMAAHQLIVKLEKTFESSLKKNSINFDVDSKTNKESNGKTKMYASTGGERSKGFFTIKKKTTSLPQISNGAKTSPMPGSSS